MSDRATVERMWLSRDLRNGPEPLEEPDTKWSGKTPRPSERRARELERLAEQHGYGNGP